MINAIGKKIKGFSAIEESILGHSEGAQDDDEMNEVLREIKTLLSPQHEALQKRIPREEILCYHLR